MHLLHLDTATASLNVIIIGSEWRGTLVCILHLLVEFSASEWYWCRGALALDLSLLLDCRQVVIGRITLRRKCLLVSRSGKWTSLSRIGRVLDDNLVWNDRRTLCCAPSVFQDAFHYERARALSTRIRLVIQFYIYRLTLIVSVSVNLNTLRLLNRWYASVHWLVLERI